MAIKKNAAKADIGPKKQVKATFAECTAKEPLKCKYHGLKTLDKLIGNILASSGHPMPFVTDKHGNEYELRLPGDIDLPMSTFSKISLSLANKGFSIYNKGLTEGGAFKYQIKPVDGKEFVTPDGEAELEDADILSSSKAPENNTASKSTVTKEDPFAELENIDTDALIAENELDADLLENFDDLDEVVGEATEDLESELLGNTDFDDDVFADESEEETVPKDLTDEQIKDLVSFKGITDDHLEQNPGLIDQYKAIILTGHNLSGGPLQPSQITWWNDLLEKTKNANEDELPALKVLKATMAKMNGLSENPKKLTKDDIIEAFSPVFEGNLEEDTEFQNLYETVITKHENPNRDPLSEGQLLWFKKASEKAHAAGVDNYALELLDKMLVDKGVMKNGGANNEAEMEKYAAQWNNLMDTAINGKHLLGTQYWAETLQPIVDAYNDAVEANDAEKANDAVNDLKNAVNEAPENVASKPPTKDSLIAEMGNVIAKIKGEGLDLTWDAKKGNALGKAFEDAINAEDIEGATKALDNFKEYVEFMESGGDAPEDDEESISTEDIKDFFKKCGIKKESLLSEENLAATKEALETGKWNGKPLTAANKKWYAALAKKAPNHKVANAINEMLSADKKPHKAGEKGAAKDALVSALSGSNESMVAEGMLKPLEHDESKFPQAVTKEMLDKALSAPNAKALGGASGDNATLVYIGGKKYVCKKGSGSHAEHIHNEVLADQAYRAGGVRAPDCKEYVFGASTYKLAEFIEGSRLSDFMGSATDEQKKAIRKDLLQGFPLDVLFSNWDVIGTDRDNVLVDKEGHAWRIDNGGSFSMAAQHNHKNMDWTLSHYKGDAEFENWEEEGGWDKRRWIDDYKTMRLDSKNKGLFDAYTTADIFLSAGNIDLGKVVESIQDEGIRKALAKPLFEMKQMATHAVSADISGIKNNAMLSSALDAMYAASKKGFREYASGIVSFSNSGIGSKTSDKETIPPFPKKKPDPPENPEIKFAQGAKLSNSEYTGTGVSQLIVNAAKTINYHAGFVQKDENGQVVGSGNVASTIDYKVNTDTIAKFNRIEREKLAELAKTDEGAAQLLQSYDSIVISMNNGYTLPVEYVKPTNIYERLPADFKTKEQIQFEKDKAKAMAEFQKDQEVYQTVTLPAYNKEKKEWEEKEKAKLHTKKGLQGNLYDIANDFMIAATNTFGIPQNNGENIDFIEKGKDQNKFGGEGKNHVKGATTHNMSFCPAASRLKVLDLLMRGMTLDEIGNIKDDDPYINNGHWSTNPARKWFMDEVKALKADPILCQRQMAAYSVFKGISVLKWENNEAPVTYKGTSIQCINHASHSVGLVRREGYDEGKLNNVAPIFQKAPLASCGFQSAGAINSYPYVYEVPLWNVGYTYSDANHKGSQYDSHQGSEHEWVASLMGLTPIKVTGYDGIQMLSILYANDTIKQEMATRAARLKPFLTSLEDLKNI